MGNFVGLKGRIYVNTIYIYIYIFNSINLDYVELSDYNKNLITIYKMLEQLTNYLG